MKRTRDEVGEEAERLTRARRRKDSHIAIVPGRGVHDDLRIRRPQRGRRAGAIEDVERVEDDLRVRAGHGDEYPASRRVAG